MGNVKPWQVVLIVVALVAVAVSAYTTFAGSDKPHLADRLRVVDINTGHEVMMPMSDVKNIPALNAETNTFTYFPVEERDGKVFIKERYMGAVPNAEGDHGALVNAKTGEISIKVLAK